MYLTDTVLKMKELYVLAANTCALNYRIIAVSCFIHRLTSLYLCQYLDNCYSTVMPVVYIARKVVKIIISSIVSLGAYSI